MENKQNLFAEFPPVSTEEWEGQILKDLKGQDYNKRLVWQTLDGFAIKPYYRKEDLAQLDYLSAAPYNFSKNNTCLIQQEIFETDPIKANRIALLAIEGGVNYLTFNALETKSLPKLSTLLQGIDINKISLGFFNQECNRFLRNLITEYAVNNDFDKLKIQGNFAADPYSAILQIEDYPDNPENIKRRLYELVDSLDTHLPNFRGITIKGQNFHNAGSTATQELAYVLSLGVEYLTMLTDQELPIDKITPFIQLSFGIGSDYFIEIAKLRAARILWAKMVEQYSPKKTGPGQIFIHAETSTFNKSLYDPHSNMLRVTTEAMSALIGGVDSLCVKPFDHIYKNPNEFSTRIANNVQLLLNEESYFDKVIDPSRGSYYIESITDKIIEAAWGLFQSIELEGGYLKAIEKGIIQDQINDTNNKRNDLILKKKEPILGASIYPNTGDKMLDQIEISPSNIPDSSETRFQKIKAYRKAIPFEQLRLQTEKFVKKGNKAPLVFMLPIGNPSMASARQIFARNFFGCAGFEIIENARFSIVENGIKKAKELDADLIVVCSSDEEYLALCPDILAELSKLNSEAKLIVAGFPSESVEELKKIGVFDFIHLNTKLVESLTEYQKLFKII